jgi:hypothetical protein
MSTDTKDGNTPPAGETSAGTFTPIGSQDELNRVLADRLSRERAKYADYDDLQAKASRLDTIEAANKSEIEKANDKAAAAASEAAAAKAEALRWKVAAKHGVSDQDAELFLTGTDEATLTRQAERLSERESDRKKQGNYVPNEGTPNPSAKPDELAAFTRGLFGKDD